MFKRQFWLLERGREGGRSDSDSSSEEEETDEGGSEAEAEAAEAAASEEEDEEEEEPAAAAEPEAPEAESEGKKKRRAAFKCRVCTKVLLLNEDSVRKHLASKKHQRRLAASGLDLAEADVIYDGEGYGEEMETHRERLVRVKALAQAAKARGVAAGNTSRRDTERGAGKKRKDAADGAKGGKNKRKREKRKQQALAERKVA